MPRTQRVFCDGSTGAGARRSASIPASATDSLCDCKLAGGPLCTLGPPSVKWGNDPSLCLVSVDHKIFGAESISPQRM